MCYEQIYEFLENTFLHFDGFVVSETFSIYLLPEDNTVDSRYLEVEGTL